MDLPEPPPEAVLLRLAREAAGMSGPAAAKAAGISKAWLSQIENGYEKRGGGARPVQGKDATIARLAAIYGVSPERLEEAGRARAAEVLREIQRRDNTAAIPAAEPAPMAPLTEEEERIAAAYIEGLRQARSTGRERGNGA